MSGDEEILEAIDDLDADAGRFRWMFDDHDDAATRMSIVALLESKGLRSLNGNRVAIDDAMLAAKAKGE